MVYGMHAMIAWYGTSCKWAKNEKKRAGRTSHTEIPSSLSSYASLLVLTCLYTRSYTCIHTCLYSCTHIFCLCVHTCVYTHVHRCLGKCPCTYLCRMSCLDTCLDMSTHMSALVSIIVSIHMSIHMYIHSKGRFYLQLGYTCLCAHVYICVYTKPTRRGPWHETTCLHMSIHISICLYTFLCTHLQVATPRQAFSWRARQPRSIARCQPPMGQQRANGHCGSI